MDNNKTRQGRRKRRRNTAKMQSILTQEEKEKNGLRNKEMKENRATQMNYKREKLEMKKRREGIKVETR